jgi:hypothetical protein
MEQPQIPMCIVTAPSGRLDEQQLELSEHIQDMIFDNYATFGDEHDGVSTLEALWGRMQLPGFPAGFWREDYIPQPSQLDYPVIAVRPGKSRCIDSTQRFDRSITYSIYR